MAKRLFSRVLYIADRIKYDKTVETLNWPKLCDGQPVIREEGSTVGLITLENGETWYSVPDWEEEVQDETN